MTTVFVVFPPAAGGNHCKNMIKSCLIDQSPVHQLYDSRAVTVHADTDSNLQKKHIDNALANQHDWHVLHGHFGEIMTFAHSIRLIKDKKFIIISPDSAADRRLLNQRRRLLRSPALQNDDYFDHEQVFLYEPFMYHYYLQASMDDIMNISVSEWFSRDIDRVLDKISILLKIDIDRETCYKLHYPWLEANQL